VSAKSLHVELWNECIGRMKNEVRYVAGVYEARSRVQSFDVVEKRRHPYNAQTILSMGDARLNHEVSRDGAHTSVK